MADVSFFSATWRVLMRFKPSSGHLPKGTQPAPSCRNGLKVERWVSSNVKLHRFLLQDSLATSSAYSVMDFLQVSRIRQVFYLASFLNASSIQESVILMYLSRRVQAGERNLRIWCCMWIWMFASPAARRRLPWRSSTGPEWLGKTLWETWKCPCVEGGTGM